MDKQFTARELRAALFVFDIDNITVKDLRHQLFNLIEQDKPLTAYELRKAIIKNEETQ